MGLPFSSHCNRIPRITVAEPVSLLSVLLTVFLAKEIFNERKNQRKTYRGRNRAHWRPIVNNLRNLKTKKRILSQVL